MKGLSLFFFFITQLGLAQNIPVFQVLYAEKASLNNGTPLKSLDKLLDETILVADSGYLVLIHETGIPVEFSGDTAVSLIELHSVLDPPKKKDVSTYQESYGISVLFLSNPAELMKFRLNPMKACHDCGPTYPIIYPPLINNRIYFKDSVKILWAHKFGSENVKATIKNVFDEDLKTYVTKDKLILIAGRELKSQGIDCVVSFTSFAESGKRIKNEITQGYLISPFYSDKIDFPYSAEIKTAAAALMAGYFYEIAKWGVSAEAQVHYELATQLSDKQFYKDILNNYLKRTGQ